jgi:hypothetical protein
MFALILSGTIATLLIVIALLALADIINERIGGGVWKFLGLFIFFISLVIMPLLNALALAGAFVIK